MISKKTILIFFYSIHSCIYGQLEEPSKSIKDYVTKENIKNTCWQAAKTGGIFLAGAYILAPFGVETYNKFNQATPIDTLQGSRLAHNTGLALALCDVFTGGMLSKSLIPWSILIGILATTHLALL